MSERERWQAKWHGLQDILGQKWALHILRLLSEGPQGFNALLSALDGLTAPMLSQRRKELRCHGLVERTVADTTPPTTTYSLTEQGTEIATQLRALESLVELHDHGDANETAGCSPTSEACRDEVLANGCVTVVDRC